MRWPDTEKPSENAPWRGRLLPLESSPVGLVSREISVSVATLERWRADALSLPDGKRIWTATARLEVVIATAAMDQGAHTARQNPVLHCDKGATLKATTVLAMLH
jgi:hypothetical protein